MLSQTEARELVERCMRVLYYRDARSYNRVRRGMNNEGEGDLIGRFSILANVEGFCALRGSLSHFSVSYFHIWERPST